jgi:predicted nucleic acid-binding protein
LLKPFAFWDTSVLVPLCTIQCGSARSHTLFSQYLVTVWWATPVEIISSFARLLRAHEISPFEYSQAVRDSEALAQHWDVMAPTDKLARGARNLLERYPLRAADALQLAAALEWCEGKPAGNAFLTFDRRLSEAARLAGFALE